MARFTEIFGIDLRSCQTPGVIVDKEGKLYRVRLDQPVEVPDVGTVTSDLWEPSKLKVIRPPSVKPVKAPAVKAPAAVAEVPEASTPAEAAPAAAAEAAAPEPGTPATRAARKPKAKKVKAPSTKGAAQARAGVKVTYDEADKMQAARNARSRVSRAVSRAPTKAKAKQ